MQVSDHRKINYDFAIFFEPQYFLTCKEWFKLPAATIMDKSPWDSQNVTSILYV